MTVPNRLPGPPPRRSQRHAARPAPSPPTVVAGDRVGWGRYVGTVERVIGGHLAEIETISRGKPMRWRQKMQVKSQLLAANGFFTVISAEYALTSQSPDGPWEVRIVGQPLLNAG